MYTVSLIDIFNRKEERTSLNLIPRVGETLEVTNNNRFYVVRGLTHILNDPNLAVELYVEAIDKTYWVNEL